MKKVISMLVCISLLASLFVMPVSADQPISVYVNGEKLEFDVAPVLLNDRTMVPMRKIFETLGATVSWNGDTETASGVRGGVRVSVSIDNTKAFIDGKATMLDQPAVLLNDRTLVPLRFIAEAYGAKVEWVDETQTVNISTGTNNGLMEAYYIEARDFTNLGSWVLETDGFLFGTHGSPDGAAGSVPGGDNATIDFTVSKDGTYKLWTLARDYATNSPGSRYYNVGLDGVMAPEKMGTHGKDGFHWQEVGVYDLKAGTHTVSVHDTSGYYARCKGFFLTSDLENAPSDDLVFLKESFGIFGTAYASMSDHQFPYWATQPIQEQEVVSLENDTFKINFIKGVGSKGNLVQNEIFVKKDGNWVKVKDKSEEFGYLMMAAEKSERATPRGPGEGIGHNHQSGEDFAQYILMNGEQARITTTDFFGTGTGYWFLPDAVQKISDKEVKLFFPAKDCATLSVTVSLDDLANEPKFELDATFSKDGAYSFLLFSGDALDQSKVNRSLVPLTYTRKGVPDIETVISETFMFTPLVAFAVEGDAGEIVEGVVVDPSSTVQDVAYLETARYGYLLRDKEKNLRPQLVAPMFGTEASNFKAGENYKFAYRVVAGTNGWYDTFKHVSQDMYNVKDIRTNYYGTLNDATSNIDTLVMDDKYGGWDDNGRGFYYAERDHQVAQCNPLQLVQRYLLTEDEAFLDERVAPTIAFMLSRGNNHFNYDLTDTSVLGSNELVSTPAIGDSAAWISLYEMSQGRMPYALQTAINKNSGTVPANAAFYRLTNDASYLEALKATADRLITKLDDATFNKGVSESGFVLNGYGDHIPPLMYAYQATGDKKYLDAAEEYSKLLMTGLSSMGYQNGYADNMYHVDPQTAADVHIINADNSNWWWHGDFQWRMENEYGTWKPAAGMVSVVDEDDAPGWTFATAGLTTEHLFTAAHSNFILMNTWAPYMFKMTEWTGDDFFRTQGRNAIVGRFTNYPGYYIERYYTNYMKPEYPYEGPEYNILYYTHVAPFQAIVDDFLMQEAWSRTGGKVEFPELWAGSYSYFNSNQYGAHPGKMYNEEGMWIHNAKDIVKSSDVNLNYVAAKKDGVFGVTLMNEAQNVVSSDITLGGVLTGYNGQVALLDKDGNATEATATNGVFSVSVPARGAVTAMVKSDLVKKPVFAMDKIVYNPSVEKTQTSHTNGKGYVIQLNPDMYHAFVYVTDKEIKSITVDYEVNGEKKSVTDDKYPFDALVKVNSGSAEFKYTIKATKADGGIADYGQGVLAPLSNGPAVDNIKETVNKPIIEKPASTTSTAVRPEISSKISADYNEKIEVSRLGSTSGNVRIVTNSKSYGIELEPGILAGLYARGTYSGQGRAFNFDSFVLTNEGSTGNIIVVTPMPAELGTAPIENFKMTNFELSAKPFTDKLPEPKQPTETEVKEETKPEAKPEATTPATDAKLPETFNAEGYKVGFIGGAAGSNLRIALYFKELGFQPSENMLKGLYIRGVLKPKDGSAAIPFAGQIESNDMREANGYGVSSVTFKLPGDPALYQLEKIEISKTPFEGELVVEPEEEAEPIPETFAPFIVKVSNTGINTKGFRVVVRLNQFPFAVKNGTLKDFPVHVSLTDKAGKKIEGDYTIINSEERADGDAVTIVLPLNEFKDKIVVEGAKGELTISPKK